MELFLSTLINGLSLGGIYAMIALGYTMVYGIAKMLNFAHGDIIMVGGYIIYVFMALNNPLLAIFMAVVGCVLLGILIEKVAYKPLRGASPLAVLITAIGVSYLLQSLAQIIFGSANKMVTVFDFGSVTILGVPMQVSALVTLGVTVVVMAALTLFIKHTRLGRAMIAVSEDKGAAQLMGINVNGIISITFAIGSGGSGGSFLPAEGSQHLLDPGCHARYQGLHRRRHWRYRLHPRCHAGRYPSGYGGVHLLQDHRHRPLHRCH